MRSELEELKLELGAMQGQLDDMRKERDIAKLTAQYTRLGYGDLAEETATAFVNKDEATMFKNEQIVLDRMLSNVVPAAEPKNNKPESSSDDSSFDDFIKGLMEI